MLIAHHIILTGYGHWLPNDPRGSMSQEVHAPELAPLAEAHFGRRKVQPTRQELRTFYKEAQKHLAYPLIWFEGAERQAIAKAFGEVIKNERLTCYACAILPNHVHLLIRKHRLSAEEMMRLFKEAGRKAIRGPASARADHPVFSAASCHLYKSSVQAMWACIRYIEGNLAKHNLPKVGYDFVTPYDNWPFHKSGRASKRK